MKGKESNPLNIEEIGVGRVKKLLVWATLGVPGELSPEQTIKKAFHDGFGVIALVIAAGEISKSLPVAFVSIAFYTLSRMLNWQLKGEVDPD